MKSLNLGGEAKCLTEQTFQTQLIVITGGPGAGKTAMLEFVRKIYCRHVAILPEAASILFSGGFWRLDSASAKNSAQRAIFYVQREMENLVIRENEWTLGLCDRGTLDGLAYWQGTEQEFFETLQTTKKAEMQKYLGVLHLCSPDEGNGYNHQNPIRIESAKIAQEIDKKIHDVWSEHPNYIMIESTNDFVEKLQKASVALNTMTKDILSGHRVRMSE